MENPVAEIPTVISLLTQSPPSLQEKTIERFFIPSAAFVHPLCRVWSFKNSRWVILKIYQWYKILSPRIELEVHSVAFDEPNLILYVTLSQIFSVWFWPFHVSPATFTVKLHLTTDRAGESAPPPRHPVENDHHSHANDNSHDGKQTNGDTSTFTFYYIAKQEDLYQNTEWIKFLLPHIGYWIVVAGQLLATLACIVGVYALWPIMWLQEKRVVPDKFLKHGNLVYDIDRKLPEIKED